MLHRLALELQVLGCVMMNENSCRSQDLQQTGNSLITCGIPVKALVRVEPFSGYRIQACQNFDCSQSTVTG